MKNSTITKLGSYPEGKGKNKILHFKCRVAMVLRNEHYRQDKINDKGQGRDT